MDNYKLTNLSPNPIDNKSYRIAVTFSFSTYNEKHKKVNLAGNIICAQRYGNYPDIDRKNIDKYEQWCIRYAKRVGLIKEGTKYYKKFCSLKYANFTAHTIPTMKLKDTKAYLILQMFFFCFDDVLDNAIDHRTKLTIFTHHDLLKVIRVFIAILKGKRKRLEKLPRLSFPLFVPLCKAFLDMRHEVIKSAEKYKVDPRPFIQSMSKYLKAVIWEHSEHDNVSYSYESYLFRRSHTIGFQPTIELIWLMSRIHLKKNIRKSLLEKRFMQAATHAVFLTNDVFSLRKEINFNEPENFILLNQKKRETLNQAFDHAIQILNSEIADMIKLGEKIKHNNPGDADVVWAVETVKNFIDGHIFWYNDSLRYGNTKINIKKVVYL